MAWSPAGGFARALAATVLVLATPVPAPAADGLFAPGAFDRLSVGDALLYRHRRWRRRLAGTRR